MLFYPFPALLALFSDLVTPLTRTFIINGNVNNGRNPASCPFPVKALEATGCINEEAIYAINEPAIGAIIAPRNPRFCFFYFMFFCFSRTVNE